MKLGVDFAAPSLVAIFNHARPWLAC